MTRSLLICGNSDILTSTLAQRASASDFRVVVAGPSEVSGSQTSPAGGSPSRGGPTVIPWNSRSPLSARALLAQAENCVPSLTDIIYVHECGGHRGRGTPFHETPALEVERTIDDQSKGRLFLLREAIAHLLRNGGGSLSLILYGTVDAETQPLDAELAGGLLSLGRSLFTWYRNEPVVLRGYQISESPVEEFCRLVVEDLVGSSSRAIGKWHRATTRPGLFTFGRQ
jgi:NAD(P)-dependent dehydrogenase (short-subunit alcohol dehydrogenase family)